MFTHLYYQDRGPNNVRHHRKISKRLYVWTRNSFFIGNKIFEIFRRIDHKSTFSTFLTNIDPFDILDQKSTFVTFFEQKSAILTLLTKN